MSSAHPPLEHLLTSSVVSLESFELSRLNAVANLRKEFRQILDEWIEAEIEARLSRWILECRREAAADSASAAPQLAGQSAQVLSAAPDPPHGDSVQQGLARPSEQLALLAEGRDASESLAEAQNDHSAPLEEGAAGALRWLERFARTQGGSLHYKSSESAEQQIAAASHAPETQLVEVLPDWHDPQSLPQRASATAQKLSSASGSSVRNRARKTRQVVVAPLGAAKTIAPRTMDTNQPLEVRQPPVATRPPVRQIPLFRSRIATAS